MSNAFALGSAIYEGDHISIKMQLGGGSIYFYFSLFCDKNITNRWILKIKVSVWLYWSVLFYAGIKNNITSNVFALGTEIS